MGLMKKLTSAIVASSLVLASVGTVLAAPTTEQVDGAFARLAAYNLAKGRLQADGTTDPALGEAITRAELVTLLVRAWGQEENAKLLQGASSFSDVSANDWFAGNVAMAKSIVGRYNLSIGVDETSFQPNREVKAVEVLGFVMKFLGYPIGSGANWAQDTIAAAVANGVITEADAAALLDNPEAPANRGLAFAILDTAFSTAKVGNVNVYQAYVDDEAPELTVNPPAEATVIATKATITGNVKGAESLYMGSEPVTVDASGNFSVEADLQVGANEFIFTAKDAAGNTTEGSYKVTRVTGAVETVAVEIAGEIVAGSEVPVTIKALDATGAEVPFTGEDLNVVIGGTIGSYNKETGTFTAATTVGAGTITATVGEKSSEAVNVKVVAGDMVNVTAASSVAPGKAVKLTAVDAYGNVVEGATFSESHAKAFIDGDEFTATAAGQYTVTATKDGKEVTGTIAVYGDADGLKIEGPTSIVGNGETEIEVKVSVVDEGGNVVTDYNDKIQYVSTDSLTATDGSVKFAKNGTAIFKFTASHDYVDADVDLEFAWDQDEDGKIDEDEAEDTTSFTISVEEQVATKLALKVDEYLPTDGYAKVTVKVLDQNDELMVDGIWNVNLKVTGPAFFADPADINPEEDLEDELADADTLEEMEFAVEYNATGDDITTVYLVPDDEDEGKVTVTATYEGLTSATATLTAAEPDDPEALKLVAEDDEVTVDDDDADENYAEFTLTVVDEDGVPTKVDGETTVTIDFGDVKEALIWVDDNTTGATEPSFAAGSVVDDEYTIVLEEGASKVTFWVAYQKAGTLSATASAKGLTKSATVSTNFVAADPMYVALAKPAIDLLDDRGAETTLTAQLYDEFGNKAAVAGYSVTFQVAEGSEDDGVELNGKEEAYTTTTDANGQASVKVTLARYVDATIIEVVDDDSDDLVYDDDTKEYDLTPVSVDGEELALATVYGGTKITVSDTVAQTVTVATVDEAYKPLRTVASGAPVVLKVTVRNNYGKAYDITKFADVDESGDPVIDIDEWFDVDASDDDAIGTLALDADDSANGVYYISGLTAKEAGSLSFTVTMAKSSDVSGTRSISVKAGDPAKVGIKEDLEVSNKKQTAFTLQVLDANDNLVSRNDAEGYDVTIQIGTVESGALTDVWTAGEDFEIRDADGYRIALDGSGNYTVTIKPGYNSLKLNLTTYGIEAGEYTIDLSGDLNGEADLTIK